MASSREVVRIEGLEGVMRSLQQLPAEVVSKNGGPVRSALAMAARMMRDATQAKLQAVIDQPNVGEQPPESTGLLKQNIVAKRGRLGRGEKGELYSVNVRRKSYPDAKGKRVTTPQVARLLEYGTEQRQPYPFIRPAFDENKGKVLTIFTSEINKKLVGIWKKLARQNGVA
jgi:HK97 gp10 family phage protein